MQVTEKSGSGTRRVGSLSPLAIVCPLAVGFAVCGTMALKIEVGRSGGVAVVVCRGRIVFGPETTELSKTIRGLLENSPRVVLNLGAVQAMDSGGLGTLIGLVASARRSGGDLKLCQVSSKVAEVLRLTKLSERVEVFPDEQAAVSAFPAL